MKQFLVPDACGTSLEIGGSDFHYLHNVRRLGTGDAFSGIDSTGNRFHLIVEEIQARSMRVQVLPAGQIKVDLPEVHLFQCMPKAGKFDQVVRMATEAGVHCIVPVFSERTQTRIDAKDVPKKMSRWQKIIQEAVQQSGSPRVPSIEPPLSLEKLLREKANRLSMMFFHQAPLASESLHEYCSEITKDEGCGICIGPEGGFSDSEVHLMQAQGWKPGYLGPFVLRTEHAGLYAVAAVQTILLEMNSWMIRKTG